MVLSALPGWLVWSTPSAVAAPIALSVNDIDDHLYQIDLASGVALDVGPTGIAAATNISSLAFAPNGTLYGIEDQASPRLMTLNTSTGAATPVGPLGIAGGIVNTGLAFGADGRLWLAGFTPGLPDTENLFEVDPQTGTATLVGPTLEQPGVPGSRVQVVGLASCGGTGSTLLALDSGRLFTLSTEDAIVTGIGDLGLSPAGFAGDLAFDTTGALRGITSAGGTTNNASRIYTIDLVSGAASGVQNVTVSGTPTAGFESLAIAPPSTNTPSCPTPGCPVGVTSSIGRAEPSALAAGDQTTVSGSGFAPGAEISLTLCSTPVQIGVVVADASGAFSANVTIPPDTSSGEHTLVGTGLDPTGRAHASVADLTVGLAVAFTG